MIKYELDNKNVTYYSLIVRYTCDGIVLCIMHIVRVLAVQMLLVQIGSACF